MNSPISQTRTRGARPQGGALSAPRATSALGKSLVGKNRFVPATERDAAQEFAAVILNFSRGELANAAKRTKDAAKAWKEGRALPSGWSLLNMAKEIPAVRNWMLGTGADTEFESPQVLNAIVGAVQTLANMPGRDGDAARLMLQKMAGAANG